MSQARKNNGASVNKETLAEIQEKQRYYAKRARETQEDLQRLAARIRKQRVSFDWGYKFVNGKLSGKYRRRDFGLIALESGTISLKEKRRVYSRYRDIAQKRLKRLKDAGFENTEIYQLNADKFKKIKDIDSEYELNVLLRDIAKFLDNTFSSLSYQRARKESNVASAMSLRYNALLYDGTDAFPDVTNEKVYWEYYKVWGEVSRRLISFEYDSEAVAVLFSEMQRRRIPFDQLFPEFTGKGTQETSTARLRFLLGNPGEYGQDLSDSIARRLDMMEERGLLRRHSSSTIRQNSARFYDANYD